MKISVQVKANVKTQSYGGKNPERTESNVNRYLRGLYFFLGVFLFGLGIFVVRVFGFFGVVLIILGIALLIGGVYYNKLIAWIKKGASGKFGRHSIDAYDFLFVFLDEEVRVTAILDDNPIRSSSFLYANISHIEIKGDSLKIFPFKKTYYDFHFQDFKDNEALELIAYFKSIIPKKVIQY
jgi:hypothetical protein